MAHCGDEPPQGVFSSGKDQVDDAASEKRTGQKCAKEKNGNSDQIPNKQPQGKRCEPTRRKDATKPQEIEQKPKSQTKASAKNKEGGSGAGVFRKQRLRKLERKMSERRRKARKESLEM